MFQIGDKVKRNEFAWGGVKLGKYPSLANHDVYTVTKYDTSVAYPTLSFEETGSYEWDASYFELDQYVAPALKVFSYFKCTKLPDFSKDTTVNKVYRVIADDKDGDLWFYDDVGDKNYAVNFPEDYGIQLVEFDSPKIIKKVVIEKPILEERKVGKVKMHLVDEGFPNAMMELGKMMGWAEEHKGYKPNDFKNLPNAEVEFPAAATRHRLKGFIQKAEGVPAIDRVDEESGISHLCHAAFNILAELELVLTGRIK